MRADWGGFFFKAEHGCGKGENVSWNTTKKLKGTREMSSMYI